MSNRTELVNRKGLLCYVKRTRPTKYLGRGPDGRRRFKSKIKKVYVPAPVQYG